MTEPDFQPLSMREHVKATGHTVIQTADKPWWCQDCPARSPMYRLMVDEPPKRILAQTYLTREEIDLLARGLYAYVCSYGRFKASPEIAARGSVTDISFAVWPVLPDERQNIPSASKIGAMLTHLAELSYGLD